MDSFVQRGEPEELFGLLADETRIEIIQCLQDEATPLSFSQLRDAVGMRDSGQFNYHLEKLVGNFVEKGPEGYRLNQAGKQVVGAIASGALTVEGTFEPLTLDDSCRLCGSTQSLRYEDEAVHIECENCGATWESHVPPAVLANTEREATPRVVSRYLYAQFESITSGFCTYCNGRMDHTVMSLTDSDFDEDEVLPADGEDVNEDDNPPMDIDDFSAVPIVEYDCHQCGGHVSASLDVVLSYRSEVTSFYYERDVDPREQFVWSFPRPDYDDIRIRNRDPFRATVTYLADADSLTLTVDDELTVVETEISHE